MRPIASSTLACLLTAAAACAYAADPEPTLQLGTVQVQGNLQVVQALHAIKLALKTPFSDSAADADKVVCRIVKQLGEAREYLDCATNRDYTQRRDATQLEILKSIGGTGGGGNPLYMLVAKQADHRIHTPVNGAGLQALLDRIPDVLVETTTDAASSVPKPVPAATTQKAPSAASSQPTTQW